MAEAIAKKIFGSTANVASAGIAPYFEGAVPETIETVMSCFGIDISNHKTRGLEEVALQHVDYIIAMDHHVFAQIIACNPSIKDKLIKWDIKDPFGKGAISYHECASNIEQCVKDLFAELKQASS